MINQESFIYIFLSFIVFIIPYNLLSSIMGVIKLRPCFGKRKRLSTASEDGMSPYSADSSFESTDDDDERSNKSKNTHSSDTFMSDTTLSSYNTSSDEEEEERASDLDRKPAAVNKDSASRSSADTSPNPFLMLGSDVMLAVVSFLEPKETLDLLTMPLCKEWRLSYTSDQELWRTACCTDPFSADLASHSASASSYDDDDDSFCCLNGFNSSIANENVLGGHRLVYTSFVRCMNYLDRIQNKDGLGERSSSLKEPNESDPVNRFPTFGVTKSLKKFLSRSSQSGLLKSVIGDGTGDMSSSPIGFSTDGREIRQNPLLKKAVKEDNKKPKYGKSMITSRLWGPSANGVPSHLNLPKSCAIYSIVNWMVAHPNVRGIQTMCIESLPSLLEDERQRITGRRVGLVEVILCAMLRFPDSVELHIAVFHAIVLLARPLGGREGMLFDNTMAETTQNIGLTSLVELSDSVSLAGRCGGHPSLNKNNINQHGSSDDEKESQPGSTGISILIDSMERFSSSEKLQSMACWAFVNVALVPLQKNMLIKLGGIEAILSAMEKHSTNFDVQFRALFALINLAVPCRQSDFSLNSNIDGADATRTETAVLSKLGARIAQLSVSAMKNFWSSEAILNRGCLVVHNLSQSSEFMPALLETPNCYQILEWCVTNHSTDRVLRRSVSSTLQRMQYYLDQHPEEQHRFSISLERQNRETVEQF